MTEDNERYKGRESQRSRNKMKKIIAIAAIAAIGTAAAECGEECVFAYQVSLSGKSSVAVSKSYKVECSDNPEVVCYRKAASFKAKGYIYGLTDETEADESTCSDAACGCNVFGDDMISYVWNTKTLVKLDDITFTTLARIGSPYSEKAKTVEVIGNIGGAGSGVSGGTDETNAVSVVSEGITLAGFGKYDVKRNYMTSASGYFAGSLPVPECSFACSEDTEGSVAFALCDDDEAESEVVPVYGKWSIKYSKSAVKKLQKSFSNKVLIPAKVLKVNADDAEGEDAP